MKPAVLTAAGTIRGLIKRLGDNVDFIESLFELREIYIDPSDTAARDRAEQLYRDRVVRITADGLGGVIVRLSSHTRKMLNHATQSNTFQQIGVDVQARFEMAREQITHWQGAHGRRDSARARELEWEISEHLELIEQEFAEQLEDLQQKVAGQYGFDERTTERIGEFLYYQRTLADLNASGKSFVDALHDDEFEQVPFINRIAVDMDRLFAAHGGTIVNLDRSLQHYIARLRRRQRRTQRSVGFLNWLRKRPANLGIDLPLASELGEIDFCRATAITLSGVPAIDNPLYQEQITALAQDIYLKLRDRSDNALSRRREKEDPSGRTDTREHADEARRNYCEQDNKRWRSQTWMDEYLCAVVDHGLHAGDGPTKSVSALAFWDQMKEQNSDDVMPTRRAWVGEVIKQALLNELVGGYGFQERFTIEYDPPLPTHGRQRERVVVRDARIAARSSALRHAQYGT